jgi:hypothetical protein
MRAPRAVRFGILAAALAWPAPATGQIALPRMFLTVATGVTLTSNDFTQEATFELYAEDARISGPVTVGRVPSVEGGMGVRLWKRLGAGAVVSWSQSTGSMSASYSLPYPFAFNSHRTVDGEASATRRTLEVHAGVHVLAVQNVRWSVVLSGGPTYARLSQQLAGDRFAYAYAYPFESVTLQETGDSRTTGDGIGGHVAATFSRRMGPRWAIDGQVRWSTAKAELAAGDTTLALETGGARLGAGVRVIF